MKKCQNLTFYSTKSSFYCENVPLEDLSRRRGGDEKRRSVCSGNLGRRPGFQLVLIMPLNAKSSYFQSKPVHERETKVREL